MKKFLCGVGMMCSALMFPVEANANSEKQCIEVAKIAGLVMAARYKGATKSELVEALRYEPIGLEFVNQVFELPQPKSDSELVIYVNEYMNLWFDVCMKNNEEQDKYSSS